MKKRKKMRGERRLRRRGITLVEVIIAVFIMSVMLIPIGILIFSGVHGTEKSRTFNVGVNFACDIMDQLMSNKLPFQAIVPDGGPAVATAFKSGIKQAGFSPKYSHLENIVGGAQRVLINKNGRYEVFLFAGVYKDEVPKKADIYKELTFNHFRPPGVLSDSTVSKDVVLRKKTPDYSPYQAVGSYRVLTANLGTKNVDYDDVRARMGFPNLQGTQWLPNFQQVRRCYDNDGYGLKYPLRIRDQGFFRKKEGTLLKLVLGLRWQHGAVRTAPGKVDPRKTQEFWLVGFKAALEEDKE